MHIVTACRVHPDVVEGMVVRWARLQKGIFVDGIQVRAILAALKIHRARDADDLVRRVQRHVEREAKCMACHARPSTRCHACHERGMLRVLAKHGITLQEDEEEDDDEAKEDGGDPNRDAREPVRDRSQLQESSSGRSFASRAKPGAASPPVRAPRP